ncbi:MAG: peptidoglycan -binding protein [Rhodospirillales bacterium]|nr:peptidoglycan -binding protein [Rhodospirillales bacterium]MDE2459027.1 peptidoglycan -binding protein [Rhodospirillales bacterium]
MSRRRGNGANGLEAWPGYVDALSTLLMVTIFVLLVFVLAEAFLSTALTGSDNTISVLREQIAELTQSLSMETSKDTTLSQELAALNAQLATAQTANTSLTQQLATDTTTISGLQSSQKSLQDQLSDAQAEAASAAGRIAALQAASGGDLQSQLTSAQTLNKQDAAQIALLNQQLAALRAQLAALQVALNAAQTADAKDNVQIADLGKQLNEALARKVEELQQYQSVFFKTLSQSLAGEKNIKVVGDRFVFESDVLFPLDQATITPAGKMEIAQVAKAVKVIIGKIPPKVNWVLSVDGYADAQPIKGGPYKSNFDLSTARALAVLDLLVADGVPENRLIVSGMGANNPIATGTTPADYAQNRRIEFRLTTP